MLRTCTAALLLAATVAGVAPGARVADAFQSDKRGLSPPGFLLERGVTRWRAVRFRPTPPPARSLPLRMRLNFFPDATFDVLWERVVRLPSGETEWTGRVAGSPIENAAMVTAGARVTANIQPGNRRQYQVRTAGDGTVWVREFATSALPVER